MSHVQHTSNSSQSHSGSPARRSDAGKIRLQDRDVAGLITLSEMYAAPGDLLGRHLRVTQGRLRDITARWRDAGYLATGKLILGPQWYWLTPAGMRAVGHGWRAGQPPLSRLLHIRASFAARMWLESDPSWGSGQAWWRCERRIRAGRPPGPRAHVPDAEIVWPSVPGSPSAGQTWAVEVELTPKPTARTTRIMAGLLGGTYEAILYLCSPGALSVVRTAAGRFPEAKAARVEIRELPPYALTWKRS